MAGFAVVDFFEAHSEELRKALISSKIANSKADLGKLQLKNFEEIGDGNLNFVYRIFLEDVGGAAAISIVVKHAPDYIKCLGPEYPLTQHRLTVEYAAMCQYHNLSPGCVPVPLLFDKHETAIAMEDLRGYVILRGELVEGRVSVEVMERIMTAAGNTHKLTRHSALPKSKFTDLCDTFGNKDMVGITEQYIFTKPFQNDDPTNKHDPLLDSIVKELRGNAAACQRSEEMKKLFTGSRESLCHGDLHTGSVMVDKENHAKLIDAEFAFVGPATFDFGMFLANLLFALIRHHILGHTVPKEMLWKAVYASVDAYCAACGEEINGEEDFVANTCGFLGCELIRRVVGAAHVADLSSLPRGELLSLKLGVEFLVADYSSRQGQGGHGVRQAVEKQARKLGL